jgi:hypothetical protein
MLRLSQSAPRVRPMRILFDHNAPYGLVRHLAGHTVARAKDCGWDRLSNGELIAAAEKAGFEVLLTADKNMRYQQNLTERKIAVVVLGKSPWRLVRLHLDEIAAAVDAASPGSYAEVDIPSCNTWLKAVLWTLSKSLAMSTELRRYA